MDKKSEDELLKKENIEKVFTSAFNCCLNFMRGNNDSFNEKDNNPMVQQAVDYGQEMFEFMLQKYIRIRENIIGQDVDAIKNRPYFYQQKIAQEFFELNKRKDIGGVENVNVAESKPLDTTGNASVCKKSEVDKCKIISSKKNVSVEKLRKLVPYEERKRVVKMAEENPTWSIKMLEKYSGCKYIGNANRLGAWRKVINQGGPVSEKMKFINKIVYEKYIEAKNNNQLHSDKLLKKWALEEKKKHFQKALSFEFTPGYRWLRNFKNSYNIDDESANQQIDSSVKDDDEHESSDESEEESQAVEIQENNSYNSYCLRKTINSSSRSNEGMYSEKALDELLTPRKRTRIVITNDKKAKAVELATRNPQWTLQQLSKEIGIKIRSRDRICKWALELQKATMKNQGSPEGENHQAENQLKSKYLHNVGEVEESPVLPENNSEKIIDEEQPSDTLNENDVEMSGEGNRSDVPKENYRDYPKENTDFKSSADEIKIFSVHSLAGGPSSITSSSFSQPIRIRIKREPVDMEFDKFENGNISYKENMSVPNVAQHRYSVSSTEQMQDMDVIDLSIANNVSHRN